MLKEKLKELRKKHKKSQMQIAELLNCAQTTYSKYEVGTAHPSIATLKMLANYYDVPINYFLDDDIEKATNNSVTSELEEMFNSLSDIEKIKVKGYMQGLIDNRLTKSMQNYDNKDKFNY